MIFLLLPLLLLSQFNCVFTNDKHIQNADLFNEFIKVMLNKNEGTSTSTHETHREVSNLSVVDAARILDLLEKNVAEKVLDSSVKKTMQIDEIFPKILKDFKEFNHNDKMEAFGQKFNIELTTMGDKVQFFMLLLSFATRLALAIGSEALNSRNHKFPADSFVLAYENLMKAFPVDYDDFIFRYYHGAKPLMNADSMTISFVFKHLGADAVTDYQKRYQSNNLKAIVHYLYRKDRVGKIIQEFEQIASSETYINQQPFVLTADKKLTNYLTLIWKWMIYGDAGETTNFDPLKGEEIVHPQILFALKHFAANLIKLMLHKKKTLHEAEKYFEQYGNVENKLNTILRKLNRYLDENRESVSADDLNAKEMLLHFEDIVQLDWNNEEEYYSLYTKLKNLLNEWKAMAENCNFENGIFIHCEIDIEKVKQEIKENKAAIKSLMSEKTIDFLMEMIEKFYDVMKQMEDLQNEINSLEEEEKANRAAGRKGCLGLSRCISRKQSHEINLNLEWKKRGLNELLNGWTGWKYRKESIVSDTNFWSKELQKNFESVLHEFEFLNKQIAM